MSANKREKDRESGTGQPIKPIPAKGGSGKGNWGSDQEQIKQGIDAVDAANTANDSSSKDRRRKEPESFGDLNPEQNIAEKKSWDEFTKERKTKTQVYSTKTVKSDMKRKYKPNAYEKESDIMFAGTGGKKKKGKKKKKKKKVLLQTAVHYGSKKPSDGGRGRGRGRGDYGNNMRGGGYRGRGGYGGGGGYNNRGGGGYGGYNRRGGGGFGSRGRGTFNSNYDNNQNYQNQKQNQNGQGAPAQQQANNNANQDNVNIPVPVQ